MNLKTTLKSAVKQKQRYCVKKENIKLTRSNFSYIIDVRSIFFKKIRACSFSQRNKFTIALKHIFFCRILLVAASSKAKSRIYLFT